MKVRELTAHLPVLLVVIALAAVCFWLCNHYDNKYAYPAPVSEQGVVYLDAQEHAESSLLYLIDGWELYPEELLTPQQLHNTRELPAPISLYIGEYGGFDLGDAEASTTGQGTYRLTILTNAPEQDYALELVPHYTRWRLWVNDTLVQCQGMDPPSGVAEPTPAQDRAVFRAADVIEIVLEVENTGGYYGGFVYPPAFGSPEAVSYALSGRLLIHTVACTAALLIALLCVLVSIGYRFTRPYGGLFVLCLCFFACTAYPLWQALGWQASFLIQTELAGYYGLFVVTVWLQGQLCGLPRRLYYSVACVGVLLCLILMVGPQLFVSHAGGLFFFSQLLGIYKWLAAAYLLASSLWAVQQGKRYSWPLLMGSSVLGCALVIDRILPLHEPILLGWNVELAGGVLIGIIAAILYQDTVRVYKEGALLRQQKQLADVQLAAHQKHAQLQQHYVASTQKQLHESRNNLLLMRHYLLEDNTDRALELIALLTQSKAGATHSYTGNVLIDAILTLSFAQAKDANVYVEYTQQDIPPQLALDDGDVTSSLLNLLNNAVEAAALLPDSQDRWLRLDMRYSVFDGFVVECENAIIEGAPDPGIRRTSKDDETRHGFGLGLIEEIAKRNDGTFSWYRGCDSFRATLMLHEATANEESSSEQLKQE